MSDVCKVCGDSGLAIGLKDDALAACAKGYAVTYRPVPVQLGELVACPCRDVKRLTAVFQMMHDNCAAPLSAPPDMVVYANSVKRACRDALDGGDGNV